MEKASSLSSSYSTLVTIRSFNPGYAYLSPRNRSLTLTKLSRDIFNASRVSCSMREDRECKIRNINFSLILIFAVNCA